MKNNKKLTWFLILLVVAIWGAIGVQVYESIAETDKDIGQSARLGSVKGDQLTKYVYASDVRDPFRYVGSVKKDSTKKASHQLQKPVWTPPPMKLTGVLTAGKKKTAMLEGSDGSVFFLQEGDTLRGVKLLKISNQTVGYVYQKRKDEWDLPQQ